MHKNIAFITYETPFAPGGGIAAVMSYLPHAVQSQSHIPTFVITPFHFNIDKTSRLESEMDTLATVEIKFDSKLFKVDINIFHKDVNWVFLKPHRKKSNPNPFFGGENHPYHVPVVEIGDQPRLLRDALFFGKAASAALAEICPTCSWTLLMQDWEAATTALFLPQSQVDLNFTNTYLTLHNSYDNGVNQKAFKVAGVENLREKGNTVLECTLPLVEDPIFTVSDQFALDLSGEIFQSEIMIPHIVEQLSPRLYGVNNGAFIERKIPDPVFLAGIDGDYSPLSEWKEKNRSQALKIIGAFSPSKSEPIWGDVNKFLRGEFPWFVMAGRDDSRQKGYELACLAIDKFLNDGGQACFIFFPIPGDEGLKGIQFIQDLAMKYPAHVLGFPFLFRDGYFPIMQGATYGMMPSYYEPFGMANEFFLNGVSCIGRATGGIIQQIVPDRKARSFNDAVSSRADRWHSPESLPTGFLFRESDGIPSALDDWIKINAADYVIDDGGLNRLEQRKELGLINAMSSEMSLCIEDAAHLYETNRNKYLEYIINGASYISANFSWEKSANKYLEKILS